MSIDLAAKIYTRIMAERIAATGKHSELKPDFAHKAAELSLEASAIFIEVVNEHESKNFPQAGPSPRAEQEV